MHGNAPSGVPVGQALILLGVPHSGLPPLATLLTSLSHVVVPVFADGHLPDPPTTAEAPAVAALNAEILRSLGMAWDRPLLPVEADQDLADSRARLGQTVRSRYLDRAIAVVQDLRNAGRPILIGDVQTTLLAPLWVEACGALGLSCRFVFLHRNPMNVALSLREESQMGISRGMQVWVRYALAALECLAKTDGGTILGFEQLAMRDPDAVRAVAQLSGASESAVESALGKIGSVWQAASRYGRIDLDRSPLVARFIKDTYELVLAWSKSPAEERSLKLERLIEAQDDFCRFSGSLTPVRHDDEVTRMDSPSAKVPNRLLILHYHLFKNAGTSVDAVLKKNFGAKWGDVEFEPPSQADHVRELDAFIAANPDLITISSHTLLAPPPTVPGVDVLPVIFVRNPLSRLRSAYEFERKQVAETVGAKLAKETDFAGYLRARLAVTGDRSCRNFHAFRLARLVTGEGTERERAFRALEQLPFIGLVEAFGKSMARLKALVLPYVPEFEDFEAWENSTATPRHGGGSKRPSLQEELGAEVYEMVREANQIDMDIYEAVARRYAEG